MLGVSGSPFESYGYLQTYGLMLGIAHRVQEEARHSAARSAG